MQKGDKPLLLALLAIAFALLLNICAPVTQSSQLSHAGPTRIQVDNRSASQESKGFWQRTIDDPINLFTAALAIFTIVLAGASIWQGLLTNQSIKLARDEFNATHRPKIFVQTVTVTDKGIHPFARGGVHRDARGIITIANGGDSPAFIIQWQAVVYYQSGAAAFMPGLDIAPFQIPSIGAPGIAPGQLESLGHQQVRAIEQDWANFVADEKGKMFFIGRITYEGLDRVRRTTGFCRQYDPLDRGDWLPVPNSQYEYIY